MSFFVYLAVLVVAAASALFGLDLLTAPLPPAKPNAQVVASNATAPAKQDKLDRREAEPRANDKQASNSDRALSPVYPASPGGAKPEVRMVYPPTNVPAGTTGAGSAEDKSTPAQAEAKQTASAQPVTKEPQPQASAAQLAQPQIQQAAEQPRQNQAQASVAPRADQPATADADAHRSNRQG